MPRPLSRRRQRSVNPEPEEDDDDYQDEPDEEAEQGGGRHGPRSSRAYRSTARRRTPASRDDDEEEEYEEADERPRGRRMSKRRGARSEAPHSSLGSDWDSYRRNKAASSTFNRDDRFTVEEDVRELIIFLADKPFATWNEHGTGQGKSYRAYVCLGDDCPFCEYGDIPSYRAAFNIAVFDKHGNPAVKYWIATPAPLDEIEEYAFNERYGGLANEDAYYEVSKKRKGRGPFTFKLARLMADEMADAYGFEPLTQDERAELADEGFESAQVVRPKTRRELREIIADLED